MENETTNQISQLIAYGGNGLDLRNSTLSWSFAADKTKIQDLIQILSSENTNEYAGYKINKITVGIEGEDSNGVVGSFVFNEDNFNGAAQTLAQFYNTYMNNSTDTMYKRQLGLSANYNRGLIIADPSRVWISIYFGADASKDFLFNLKLKKQVEKDLETEIEFDEIDDFDNFLDTVVESQNTTSNYKKYFKDKEKIKEADNKIKEADNKIKEAEEEEERFEEPIVPKAKKAKITAPPPRIQPKRKARFTGKYGKGIDFFKINNHTTNLASYTGDTTLYNLSNQIREKLERLRRYAAIHS